MNVITAALVKKLRLRTGAGFMECKKALIEENGNIELSIDNLRKSGKIKAVEKINNITNQGVIFSQIKDNFGIMIELNCETDFVAKDIDFFSFGQEIISTALRKKIIKFNDLKDLFEEKRTELILKFNENIKIRRCAFIEGENIISYVHSSRIGVLLSAYNLNNHQEVLKQIALHVIASKPEYLHPSDVSKKIFDREYQIQLELAKKLNKPSNILNIIVNGKMKKFVNNISLSHQNFIIDPTKKVGDILKQYNAQIISFKRFEIGEN